MIINTILLMKTLINCIMFTFVKSVRRYQDITKQKERWINMKNKELKQKILQSVTGNHMWINAFSLIHPSDDIKLAIGDFVIQHLQNKKTLLPHYNVDLDLDEDEVQDLAMLAKSFYCRFNAS